MSGILGSLGIHWQSLLAQAINFAIVAFVLYKFAIKPALISLDKRVKQQEKADQGAKNIETKLLEIEENKKIVIDEARKESRKIIEETEKSAENLAERIKKEAELNAKKVVDEARVQMESEKNILISEIKKELLSIVGTSIESSILKNLSKEDKEKLTKDASEEALRLYSVKK